MDEGEMYEAADADWDADCAGHDVLTRESFFGAVFELADIWCRTLDFHEYLNFIDMLLKNYKWHARVGSGRTERSVPMEGIQHNCQNETQLMKSGGLCEGDKWYHSLREGTIRQQQ